MNDRYFDHAATTPVDARVLEAMLPWFAEDAGNAHSIHSQGRKAMAAVERAREQVASLLEVEPPQVFFTSGATEAANWVLSAFDRIAISPFEHSAVREPALSKGAEVLPNDGLNLFPPRGPVDLVAVMSVNNEIGARWDVRDFAPTGAALLADVTQSAGKLPLALEEVDFAILSAHKVYGPKGIGALVVRDQSPSPLLLGGEQEQGQRAGTLNVPAIVGFGAAAEIAQSQMEEDYEHVLGLRETFLEEISTLPDVAVHGGDAAYPGILSVSFLGIEGETLVVEMDRLGFAISAGAACSSRSTEPSHVLQALELPLEWLRGTVRVSFGRVNSPGSCRKLALEMGRVVQKLRTM